MFVQPKLALPLEENVLLYFILLIHLRATVQFSGAVGWR